MDSKNIDRGCYSPKVQSREPKYVVVEQYRDGIERHEFDTLEQAVEVAKICRSVPEPARCYVIAPDGRIVG